MTDMMFHYASSEARNYCLDAVVQECMCNRSIPTAAVDDRLDAPNPILIAPRIASGTHSSYDAATLLLMLLYRIWVPTRPYLQVSRSLRRAEITCHLVGGAMPLPALARGWADHEISEGPTAPSGSVVWREDQSV